MSRCFRAQLASLREWCRNVKEISSTLVTLKHRKIINASYKQSTKTVRNKSYVYQISVWDFFQIFALPGQIPVFFHGFGKIFFSDICLIALIFAWQFLDFCLHGSLQLVIGNKSLSPLSRLVHVDYFLQNKIKDMRQRIVQVLFVENHGISDSIRNEFSCCCLHMVIN